MNIAKTIAEVGPTASIYLALLQQRKAFLQTPVYQRFLKLQKDIDTAEKALKAKCKDSMTEFDTNVLIVTITPRESKEII